MAEEQSNLLYPELGENNYLNTGFDGFLRRDTYDLSKEFSLSEQSQLGLGELAGSDILAWGDVYDDGNKPDDNADVTASHTAAAITGQGNLATRDTVSASYIDADAVTAEKINVVGLNGTTGRIIVADATDANTVTGGVNSYASTLIAPGKILISGATVLSDWASGTDATKIDGGDIYTGTVTATQISVTNLAAINADLGTVTAGTITGLTIQSSASANTGVKITTEGLFVYGQTCKFYTTSGGWTGMISGASGAFNIAAQGGINLVLSAGENILCNDTIRPVSSVGGQDCGTSTNYWGKVWTNDLDADGTAQVDALRIDQTPTTGLTADQHVGFACTASFTISLNGVSYKIPCVAA